MDYLIRRVSLFVPTMLAVSIVVFFLTRALPGDAVDQMLIESPYITEVERDAVRKQLGLSDPLAVQYVKWVGQVMQGDLGSSLFTKRTVREELAARLPVTGQLALMALALSLSIALPLGTIAALKRDSWVDHVARLLSITGVSVPSFVMGTLVLTYLSIWFRWIPPIGYTPIATDVWRNLQQFLLPAAILGTELSASVSRMTRSSVLEVLRQDYIRTAESKGLSRGQVVRRHVLRNSLNPILTIAGLQVAGIMGGTVILEVLFGLPGIGRLMYDGILQRDYPLVQGLTLLAATVYLTVNLVVDLAYKVVDPRIQL
ncbi:MAG: ABC transporter permease [Chloroflexi bacterium]|nr:ABC transporter permease [Chloroflexota bacterium]